MNSLKIHEILNSVGVHSERAFYAIASSYAHFHGVFVHSAADKVVDKLIECHCYSLLFSNSCGVCSSETLGRDDVNLY